MESFEKFSLIPHRAACIFPDAKGESSQRNDYPILKTPILKTFELLIKLVEIYIYSFIFEFCDSTQTTGKSRFVISENTEKMPSREVGSQRTRYQANFNVYVVLLGFYDISRRRPPTKSSWCRTTETRL